MHPHNPTAAIGSLLFIACLAIGGCRQPSASAADESAGRLSLTGLLAEGDIEGYRRADEPREFRFPDDHGAHPDFRNEWWYLTGNLTTAEGRRFGYQFTLFRTAISPRSLDRDSEWASRQVYMAHFALTDVGGGAFHAFERFSRGAIGLAGVTSSPFRAWLDDWALSGENPPPFRLRAGTEEIGVELELRSAKPIVLQGDRGLSQKGSQPGNASYYYSMTRMPTRGVVSVGFDTFVVQGSSWLDREWSTSALEPSQTGWDWFALQLSDGHDLMIYQLRTEDNSVDPLSSGTLVERDGSSARLAESQFSIEARDWWTSPATRVRYPAAWSITVPDHGIELRVSPRLKDQELDLSVLYWEGAVAVSGTSDGRPVTGDGYVELTGYDGSLAAGGAS